MKRASSPKRATLDKRRDDAMAKLAGRISKRAGEGCEAHTGARVQSWRILATDGHVALLVRGKAKPGAKNDSALLELAGATVLQATADMQQAAKRVAIFGNHERRDSVAAVSLVLGWDRLWMYASHRDDCAREWMPVSYTRGADYHDTPIAFSARLLDEGLTVAGTDGRVYLPPSRDRAVLFEAKDRKYALLVMPLRAGKGDCADIGDLARRFEPMPESEAA